MRAEGYGADVELVGELIRVTGKGVGKAALGGAERDIPLSALTSAHLKPASALVNGHLELVTAQGKTLVHFRKKQAAGMRELYERIVAAAPSVTEATSDAPLAHAWQPRPEDKTPQQAGPADRAHPIASTPAGWYPAYDRPGLWRWWDGSAWTDQYHGAEESARAMQPALAPVPAWAVHATRHDVVGEQYHAPGLRRVAMKHGLRFGDYGATIEEASAAVVAEPSNEYDQEAVAVFVEGERVGYLPRDVAATYARALLDLAEEGHCLGTTARVWVAPEGDARAGSVTVKLPPPGGVQSFNYPPSEPYQVLPAGSPIQVTEEDQHMDVLGSYVSDADRHLAVTLHCVDADVGADVSRRVAVRLDGQAVGVLTKTMSEKVADLVDFVTERGRLPVCRAVLKGSPLRAEIVLHVAKSHEVSSRWMDSVRGVQ